MSHIINEILFGKVGAAEREKHKSEEQEHGDSKSIEVPLQKKYEQEHLTPIQPSQSVVEKTAKPSQTKLETNQSPIVDYSKSIDTSVKVPEKPSEAQLESESLDTSSDVQSAMEQIKGLEIREGIQTVQTTKEPIKKVAISKDPLVQDHIRPVEIAEVQPVIHREREQVEVHQIIENEKTKEILPTVYKEMELPAQYAGTFKESDTLAKEKLIEANDAVHSSVDIDEVTHIRIIKEPVVEEKIIKTVIDVIQPVIQKETIAPVVIKQTLPIYERVQEAPQIIEEPPITKLG